jgi:YesN/AraC family two-component response regulator
MPSISGIRLAEKVKDANPNVKVLLLTGSEIRDNEFSKVFSSMQVDGFLQKPVGIRDLAKMVLSLLQ